MLKIIGWIILGAVLLYAECVIECLYACTKYKNNDGKFKWWFSIFLPYIVNVEKFKNKSWKYKIGFVIGVIVGIVAWPISLLVDIIWKFIFVRKTYKKPIREES